MKKEKKRKLHSEVGFNRIAPYIVIKNNVTIRIHLEHSLITFHHHQKIFIG